LGATVKPGVPDGTMIAEISLSPSGCWPVTAVAVTNEVMSVPELVMNDFEPLTTHWSPSRRAVVRFAPAASDPLPDSVRPNAPSRRPAVRSGSQRSRCSRLPKR
jgi:hypothetical protein